MKAMVLSGIAPLREEPAPLKLMEMPVPVPVDSEILIKVSACAICHTELDEIEGRTPPPLLPVIPGHQVVGTVETKGSHASKFNIGDRVGIGWIYSSCKECAFCLKGEENLCEEFRATGRDANGGYAEFIKVQEDFAFPVPQSFTDAEAAPLLCAGSIGYRSLRLSKISDGGSLGLTGFGASGHLVLKMVNHLFRDVRVYVFARRKEERDFAMKLGSQWSGEASDISPEKLDSIIDTTPAWSPVVEAMKNLKSGGRLVINAIRKEDSDKEYLSRIDYSRDLWMEKEIKSVANVSRQDILEFMELAAAVPIKPDVQEYRLLEANRALLELKSGKIRGAKVLMISS